MANEKIVKFEIPNKQDRDTLLSVLAHNGYKVTVNQEGYASIRSYYVCCEMPEKEPDIAMA